MAVPAQSSAASRLAGAVRAGDVPRLPTTHGVSVRSTGRNLPTPTASTPQRSTNRLTRCTDPLGSRRVAGLSSTRDPSRRPAAQASESPTTAATTVTATSTGSRRSPTTLSTPAATSVLVVGTTNPTTSTDSASTSSATSA